MIGGHLESCARRGMSGASSGSDERIEAAAPLAGNRGAADLRLVIVTYNSAEALPGLLDSLPAGLAGVARAEIVVVDNGSTDQSVAIARAHPCGARVIATGRNAGYAAGINAGCRDIAAHADLLVLNPDVRLGPGSVLPLLERLRDGRVGVAVPLIRHEDGTPSFSLRREPSILTAWADALLFGALARWLDRGEVIHRPGRYRQWAEVDWASGAILAIAARARLAAGAWDESFFLYSEEVDYQRRVRAKGLSIVFEPRSAVIHVGGDYRRNAELYALLTANRIRDYSRHHRGAAAACFRLAVAIGEGLRAVNGSRVHRAGLRAALGRWRSPSMPMPERLPARQGEVPAREAGGP
jgi:GT2 family glycosyltransferase